MKFANVFALLLLAVIFAGCKKSETATAPRSAEDSLPTRAQPKLPTLKIYLGAETLDAELATTRQEEETGMMFRTNILETDAMLFVFPFPQRANFWMKNCPESISAAYISPDGVIQEIHHLEKEDTNTISSASESIGYVLETKDGWFGRHNVTTGMVIRTERGSLHDTFFGK
ncbi:MAG TPA: DUF192 domain-containing protein [Verrucomicrobiae bacterium]|nr:DUF192 domain-containing protein [Verrucomicrobiae bacterium]